ncbi:MAG: hypothetical protein ACRBDL_10890 [Alphaproteobacteria bacterium]
MRQSENIILQAQSFASRDIMSFGVGSPLISNPLEVGIGNKAIQSVNVQQSSSLMQRVVGQPQKTIAQTVLPRDSFRVSVKESAMMRDASTGPITDGAQQVKNRAQQVKNRAQQVKNRAQSQQDTEHEIGRLTTRLQNVRRQADDALGCAANDLGIDKGKAVNSFAPETSPTKISAGITVACDMATGGGGTLATILMQGKTVVAELTEKERKCNPDQQEKLLDNELARLQSSGSNASSSHANEGGSVQWDVPSKGNVDFSMVDTKTLRDIHALNFDKLHQQIPEMADLHDTRHGLQDVEDNHGALGDNVSVAFEDVYITSASISGIIRLNTAGLGGGDVAFNNVSMIGSSLSASAPEYQVHYAISHPAYI